MMVFAGVTLVARKNVGSCLAMCKVMLDLYGRVETTVEEDKLTQRLLNFCIENSEAMKDFKMNVQLFSANHSSEAPMSTEVIYWTTADCPNLCSRLTQAIMTNKKLGEYRGQSEKPYKAVRFCENFDYTGKGQKLGE
ncbi:hypothetical protein Y032_0048g1627 [Ancylostoma ceylanicum]|nr:hypothetical protein Y032_0048g1627 [Ancylostoma ceylanicum]